MKKFALSLVELMIAMTLVVALTALTLKAIKIFIKKDTDLIKYRPVLASISEAVYQMINDPTMYPTKKGFADIRRGQYEDDEKVYEGKSKFRKLFKSKFNILEGNIEFDKSIGSVPAYKYNIFENGKIVEKVKSVDFKELNCFVENRGVMYCLPDTLDEKDKGELTSIYIRTYFNTVDVKRPITYDNKKAIYFEVLTNGKVLLPPTVKNEDDKIVVNCIVAVGDPMNNYNQCLVRSEIANVDIYTTEDKEKKRAEAYNAHYNRR